PGSLYHGFGQAISVGTDGNGYDEVYLQASDNRIYRFDRGTWTDTKGYLATIQAGHGEVFGLTSTGNFYAYGNQAGWSNQLGCGFRSLSVGTDRDGSDEVWLHRKDGSTWRYDQGAMTRVGYLLSTVQAGHGEVFGLSSTGTVYAYRDQSGWSSPL